MIRCAGCGGPIVECAIDHPPGDLCRGWRHVYSDDLALYHSIVCPTSGTADDRGWSIARPSDLDGALAGLRRTVRSEMIDPVLAHPVVFLVVAVLVAVVVSTILDALGWSS